MATQAGHVPIVVTRDREGVLRGFVNVCRHRAYVIARDNGCRETLQCPYHAWTYELDGSLRRAPRSEREEGFDPADFSLLPVSVETWGPFRLRQSRPGRRTARRDARRPARDRRRQRRRLRRVAAALAPCLADRGELEGRARELPRVLPLPRRPPGLQQGDRRRPRLLRAVGLPDLLEPDRPDPGVGPQRQGQRCPTCPRVT